MTKTPEFRNGSYLGWSILGLIVTLATIWVIKKYFLPAGISTPSKSSFWLLEIAGTFLVFTAIVLYEVRSFVEHIRGHHSTSDLPLPYLAVLMLCTLGGSLVLYVGLSRYLP